MNFIMNFSIHQSIILFKITYKKIVSKQKNLSPWNILTSNNNTI